jgi:hypothetical protein
MNLNNFKMTEAMGLKIITLSTLEWHHLLTKFHENLPRDLKDICISIYPLYLKSAIAFSLCLPYGKQLGYHGT